MKIFLLNPIKGILDGDGYDVLEQYGEVVKDDEVKPILEVPGIQDTDTEKIVAIDPDFSEWKFPKEIIKKIPNLKAIVLTSTSFSWIDIDAAKALNIPVVNTRNFSTNAVAEWAILMALNVYRKVPLLIKDGFKLDYAQYQGIELNGKTAAIIGLGNIGTRIAEIAQGLGMNVIYWSKNSEDNRFSSTSLEEVMKTADIIFPAVAQNEHTSGLITDEMLESMKKEALFISIVHHVYNHDLLLQLVADEKIYGYGFEDKAESFAKYKGNVWAAPELAWCTEESFERNSESWLKNIISAAKGNYENKVN